MNELHEKERYHQRLDQLRDAHPEIYDLSHSDALVHSWLRMWATSEMSMEQGLVKLCLLLCEHRKELTEGLLEQLSCRPRIFGVDLAKEGGERAVVYPAGDLRSWTTYGKQVDDNPDGIDQRREQNRMLWERVKAMPIASRAFTDGLTYGTGTYDPGLKQFNTQPQEDKPKKATDPLGQILQNAHQTREEIRNSVFQGPEPEDPKPEEPQEKLRDKFKMRF